VIFDPGFRRRLGLRAIHGQTGRAGPARH
jgi:hypothetical protein